MKRMRRKFISQTGESIGETLVALLIAVLALVMLAGALSASNGVVMKGRNKLDEYYSANDTVSGVVRRTSGGTSVSGGITIKDETSVISETSYNITYYKNAEFENKAVIAYELNE